MTARPTLTSIGLSSPDFPAWRKGHAPSLILALSLAGPACGCSTLVSRQMIPTDTTPWSGRPYSGAELGLNSLRRDFEAPISLANVVGMPFDAADLALSTVADTALLPLWAIDHALSAPAGAPAPQPPPPANESPQ